MAADDVPRTLLRRRRDGLAPPAPRAAAWSGRHRRNAVPERRLVRRDADRARPRRSAVHPQAHIAGPSTGSSARPATSPCASPSSRAARCASSSRWSRPTSGSDRPATRSAILMPDLSRELIAGRGQDGRRRRHARPRPRCRGAAPRDALGRVPGDVPRLGLAVVSPPRAPAPALTAVGRALSSRGLAVGDRFLAGWDAFDRQAPAMPRAS